MAFQRVRSSGGIGALWPLLMAIFGFGGAAWAQEHGLTVASLTPASYETPRNAPLLPAPPRVQQALVWIGADLDGDGQPDFVDPTGKPLRGCDEFGCGAFGSERDHGGRRHEGADFDATAGQTVNAPISGYVSKIGEAYADDGRYRFVQIDNPALHYSARVFYVDPSVREGQSLRLGQPIGRARSLEPRYPGITNHVHVEISRLGGRKVDPERMIFAREIEVAKTPEPAPASAAQAAAPVSARG